MKTKNWLITIALASGSVVSSQAVAAPGAATAGMAGGSAAGALSGSAIPGGNLGSNGAPAASVISGGSAPTISGSVPGLFVNGSPVIQNGVSVPNSGANNAGANQGVVNPTQPSFNQNGTPINNSATENPSTF
jgi:hypothetical protein